MRLKIESRSTRDPIKGWQVLMSRINHWKLRRSSSSRTLQTLIPIEQRQGFVIFLFLPVTLFVLLSNTFRLPDDDNDEAMMMMRSKEGFRRWI